MPSRENPGRVNETAKRLDVSRLEDTQVASSDKLGRLGGMSSVVIGYHGTSHASAETLELGGPWGPSTKDHEWLGHGVYFWLYAPKRGEEWARKDYPDNPAVIEADIHLGRCLNLLDVTASDYLAELAKTDLFARALKNAGGRRRSIDCTLVNLACEIAAEDPGLAPFDTVMGAFQEGNPIAPGGNLCVRSHVQIAVRNPERILTRKASYLS